MIWSQVKRLLLTRKSLLYARSFTSNSSTQSVYLPSSISLFRKKTMLCTMSRYSAGVTAIQYFFCRLNICHPSFVPSIAQRRRDRKCANGYVSDPPQQVTLRGELTCSRPPRNHRWRCGNWRSPERRSRPSASRSCR